MLISEDRTVHLQEKTVKQLRQLGFGAHRLGYKCLTLAVPRYAGDDTQSLSKEVYPYVAEQLGYPDWHGVERAIRTVVQDGWNRRDPEVWEAYFPNQRKAPTNKQFIAVLAERLR